MTRTPREQIEKLEADIESINQTSEELEKKITEAAESRDKLREACDYFRMRLKNVEVTCQLSSYSNLDVRNCDDRLCVIFDDINL